LYYFVLFVGLFFSAALQTDWAWYFAYLQNFLMIAATKNDYVFGTHLWSLAVEEQFYIVWPLLMLFAPRRWILPLISVSIAAAVVIRFYLSHRGWTSFDIYVFTPSNLDTLGLGALLAYFVTYRREQVRALRNIALFLGFLTFVIAVVLRWRMGSNALVPVPVGLFSLWMISWAADGIPGLLGRLISLPPIIYVGRISYGIYVYHYFVPIALQPLFERMSIGEGNVLFAAICFVVTLIVASLSWFLMEKPINSLKDKLAANPTPIGAAAAHRVP
jgi:peptidoglycan/LPS O-acetylase OafA/YrhL